MSDTDWPERYHQIIEAVVGYLDEGPLAFEVVVRRLRDAGLLDAFEGSDDDEVAEHLDDLLIEDDRFWHGPGNRLARVDGVLAGRVFTHRVSGDELRTGRLAISPDLDVVGWTEADQAVTLTAGGELVADFEVEAPESSGDAEAGDLSPGHWVGPDGWLAGFQPGDLLAMTMTDDGVEVSAVPEPGDDELERAVLAEAVEHRIVPAMGEEPAPVVFDALVVDRGVFTRPVRPVGELLEAIGLQRRGWEWGRAAGDWSTSQEVAEVDRRQRLATEWAFDECCQRAFDVVVDVFAPFAVARQPQPPGRERAIEVLRSLAHGPVAAAFASEVLGDGSGGDDRLEDFASRLVDAGGRHAAAAHLLLALDAERRGASDVAVDQLEAAVRLDPGSSSAAEELSAYVLDQGDLDRAIRLLEQAGIPADDPELTWLRQQRERATERYQQVGRNDPCPCGSGRKYKSCCERNPEMSLAQRVDLLVHKVAGFALRPHRRARVEDLADLVDELSPIGEELPLSPESLLDLAMFEGNLAEEYLGERWDLLPRDERALLEAAVVAPRLLWEVVAVDEGRSLTVRDLGSGEERTVIERAGSQGREVGELLLARVVPVGGVPVFLGIPVTVPSPLQDPLLALLEDDPDDWDLVTWLCEAATAGHHPRPDASAPPRP